MIHYREYQPSDLEVQNFEREQRAAKLVTVGDSGWPCAGVYPFLRSGERLEMHLVRTDEQVGHLERHPLALFLIDDILSSVPSHWFGDIATHADQLHRSVQYDCEAVVIRDDTAIRRHLVELLARYQPEGNFVPLDDPGYAAKLRAICLVQLRPVRVRAKFKLGQKLESRDHEILLNQLQQRGNLEDGQTLAAIAANSR